MEYKETIWWPFVVCWARNTRKSLGTEFANAYFNRCEAEYIDENIEENYTFGLLLPSGVRSIDFLDFLDVNYDYEERKPATVVDLQSAV